MKICPVCRYCYEDAATACARDQSVLVPSRHGDRLIADKYRLERLLGRGGMGAVYYGVHVELDRPTAIKLLLPDFLWDEQALERFRREARAAARLNHPNIVDTYDYGLLPTGEAYIVMELIEGQTLREYMDAAQALPFVEAVHIARQIADGIEVAHHSGIVHRDLKPSNIILARDHRNRVLVKVVDFGIAKLKELSTSGGLSAVTNTGAIVGTPRYMAPEQCAGAEVDARSDIYSLGVILFEMLAGRPPFDAPSATALALKQVQEPPPPLKSLRADAPDELARLVMHALAKDPAARPQTAGELARALAAIEDSLEEEEAEERTHVTARRPNSADAATLAPSPHTARDAGPQTVAPPNPSATALSTPAPPPTDRAGSPTGEFSADHGAASAPEPPAPPPATSATLPAASILRPAEEDTADPAASREGGAPPARPFDGHAAASTPKGGGRTLTYALVALAAVVALGTLYALTRRADAPATAGDPAAQTTPTAPAVAEATPPAPAEAASPQAAAMTSASPAPDEVDEAELRDAPESDRRALVRALDQWVAATNARDLNGQLAHYAPRLTSFYLSRGVTRDAVRAEKQRTIGVADEVQISVSDPLVRVARDGRTAVLRFRKQFVIDSDGQRRRGEVLQELHWQRTPAGWRITSERDLQVIR
jgi:serine/threonine protein kinase/ketosteroid isomerase-like protein